MWDDAMLLQGRHTKRKWNKTILWMLLAALAVGAAWVSVHPEAPAEAKTALLARLDHAPKNCWIPGEKTPETAFFLKGRVYTKKGDRLLAWDLEGNVRDQWELPLEQPQVVRSEAAAVFYETGGRTLYRLDGALTELAVPTGIAAAAVSGLGQTAVLTQGSGAMTLTRRFDRSGDPLEDIQLTDQAMVLMTYLRNSDTLAAACLTAGGDWVLRFFVGDNTIEQTLEAQVVYDLRPWADGVVLWTDRGLTAFGGDGTCVQQVRLAPEELLLLDSGSFCGAAVRRGAEISLVTITEQGVTETALEREPRDLSVCGSSLALLDSQALLLYDNSGTLLRQEPQGTLASSVQALDGGGLMFGETGFFRAMNE